MKMKFPPEGWRVFARDDHRSSIAATAAAASFVMKWASSFLPSFGLSLGAHSATRRPAPSLFLQNPNFRFHLARAGPTATIRRSPPAK